MIGPEQYMKRARTLYSNDRDRWRKRLQKKAPKGVILDIPADEVLPYSQAQFVTWLRTQIEYNAVLCPYCRAAIDIISMQLDHKTPLNRGGGPGLDNKQVICARCNSAKGEFTEYEYNLIVEFMNGPGASFRQRLEGVLTNGSMGKMLRNFPKKKGGKPKVAVQPPLEFF